MIDFLCQRSALKELRNFASARRHSILLEGPEGCGKTYLASEYARFLGVPDFQKVEPSVQEIRDCMEACSKLDTPVVICIENIDSGVIGASYTLLKFLEEPSSNVFIVVTCSNTCNVPDTIPSRCVCVSVAPPVDNDIVAYAQHHSSRKYDSVKDLLLWKCVRTFKDADTVLSMSDAQLEYFDKLSSIASFNDSISNMMWKVSHYEDNSETPVELVILYLSKLCKTLHIQRAAIACIQDLHLGRIASHAVIARFLLECKYCE